MTSLKINKKKITNISISARSSQRATVGFSDGSFLILSLDSIVKLSLTKGRLLSSSQYQKAVEQSLLFLSREYALRQIAISPKTPKILSAKLNHFFQKTVKKYQITPSPLSDTFIQKTLDYLKNKGLFDQKNYVEYFLRRHPRLSARHLNFLLLRQGIDPAFLPQNLASTIGEKQKIKNILQKKIKNTRDLSDYQQRKKIVFSLGRRGFSYPDIKAVIDELLNLS